MKKVIIFGATGGLGCEISKKLIDYEVISLGSSDLDITNYKEVCKFFKTNSFDIVINFAGVNFDKFAHKLTPNDTEIINKQIDVNIKGTINIVSSCLPSMRENNFGRIILISSVLAEKPVVSTSIYSGCKGFLDSFVKTIGLENANKNISCNTIQLGYFDGGMTYKIPEQIRNTILETIPSKRWGSIDELENTIRYFINTSYVNGINLKINGGIDF
jgi:NAD(P)-dependent dehydrogenase (short-subunit alcohol dehydrogenase family)